MKDNVIPLKSGVRAPLLDEGAPPSREDEIDNFVGRLQAAWERVPHLRLGQLVTKAQAHALASQVALTDGAFIEMVERFAEAEGGAA